MVRHKRACSKNYNVDISIYMKLGKDQSGNLTTFSYNKETTIAVDYIVRAEQPFIFENKRDFTGNIQKEINPQYKGFSASNIKILQKCSL